MQSKFNSSIKILLSIFVLVIPLTNRDIFSFGSDFLIPVRVVFLGMCVLISIYLMNIITTKGIGSTVNWVKKQLKDRLVLLLISLWIIRVISLVNSRNWSASLNLLLFYTSMIIVYLILKYLYTKDIYFGFKLFKMYLISIVFSVFYALTQILANLLFGIKLPGLLVGGNYFRVPGPFYDANHLPAFLLTGIPMFVSLGWFFDRNWKKMLLFFFALVSSLVLFLTFSRSGFIGFGVVIVLSILFIVAYRYWSKLVIPLTLVSIVVLVVFLSDKTSLSLLDRLSSIFNSAEKSTQAHTLLFQGEIDLFLHNPIIGVGYGSFSEHFRNSYYGSLHLKVDPTQDIRLPAHSIWFEVLTETGTLGIITYVLIMITILRELFIAIRTALNKEWRMYFIALFSSTVALLVAGIFYSYNLEFFWFFLFTGYLLARNYRKLVPASEVSKNVDLPEKVNWPELFTPIVVTVFAGFIIFNELGRNVLTEFDEAIYGAIAKNMIRTSEFLVPTFRDGLPWFEKPPLYLWLTAPMVKLFGIDAFSVRFWSAFFGVATVFATYIIGRTWFNRFVGVLSAIVLLGSFHFIRYSRMGMTDVTLTFFMAGAFFLFFYARRKPILLLLAGISLGLAFMTKGVVSLLMLPSLIAMLILYSKEYKKKMIFLALLGFATVVLPWHWYMFQKFGNEFIRSYLGYHVFLRFSSDIEGKTLPFWTYFVVIRNSLRIWLPVFLLGLSWLAIRLSIKRVDVKKTIILFVWFLSILIPFSFAKSKLVWYLVPIYPVIALITAYGVYDILNFLYGYIQGKRHIRRVLVGVLLIVLAALTTFSYVVYRWDLIQEKDYNRDALTLVYKKAQVEPTGRYPLMILGVGEGFTLFYGEGNVDVAPENMLEGLMDKEVRRFYIVKSSIAKELLERKGPDFPASIIATEGEFSLLLRHAPLLD